MLRHLLNSAGLDKSVSVTLLARIWSILGGLGTLYFVSRYLTPELQGYYYTFNSLIALQVFAELGLNYAIIQITSHEMAKLHWKSDGTLSGDPQAKRRLQSLMKFALAWFGAASVLVLVILLPAGIIFFRMNVPIGSHVESALPWAAVASFTAVAFLINAALAILEGCNKVAEVASIRFAQTLASVLIIWLALANRSGLYALAIGSGMMALVGIGSIYIRHRSLFIDLWRWQSDLPGMHWKQEIWPFQWRIAVSWASGWLIFQIFNPLLFATHGPEAAGQMGMSLQIISAMNGVAGIWITTKAPLFGQLVAQNNRSKLDAIFKTALIKSFVFLLAGVATFFVCVLWLQNNYPYYAQRLLPPIYLSALCLVCIANHFVFAEATYLRSHKQEPFMILSLGVGILTTVLALIFIQPYGLAGAVYPYALSTLILGLGGGTFVFYRKRREWGSA